MDSNAFDVVSGICRRHIDHVESGAVWRHLDGQVPATTSSAGQVGRSAAIRVERLNCEGLATRGPVATARSVRGASYVGRGSTTIQRERIQRSSEATTGLADRG